MTREGKKKLLTNALKLIGIILGFLIASYAWFVNNPGINVGSVSVRTSRMNEIVLSIDGGETWSETLELTMADNFKFSNEVTSDGIVFYKALNKRDDGTPISFQTAIPNHDYFEFELQFKAKYNTGIFLEQASVVKPTAGLTATELLGNNSINKSKDGSFSKDLIAGSVRVAFIENDLNQNDQYIPRNITSLVWAPNKNYSITYDQLTNTYNALIDSTDIQPYNYVDANNPVYYTEVRVPNIKDEIKADIMTRNAYGDPMITYIANGENDTQIVKSLTVRIWIEGNDRDAVTALKGGLFQVNIMFAGIDKEHNYENPGVLVDQTNMIISNYDEGMEYSKDFGTNWNSYEDESNPVFVAGDIVYVRFAETANSYASTNTILNF